MVHRRYFSKIIPLFLIFTMVFLSSFPAYGQISALNQLDEVERVIYGQPLEEVTGNSMGLIERLNKIENTLFNQEREGSLQGRADRIVNYVLSSQDSPSLIFVVNTLEWTLSNNISQESLLPRIDDLEMTIFGETKPGALVERIKSLSDLILPEGGNFTDRVTIPAGTAVNIVLLDGVDSRRAEVGQIIKFQVDQDIKVNDYLVIPSGAIGMFEVIGVEDAGQFGKDGQVKLKASALTSIDGTPIKVDFINQEKGESLSREKAIGVGLLGTLIMSHPIGLVASFFIKGESMKIPAGSEFKLQTAEETSIYGLKFQ